MKNLINQYRLGVGNERRMIVNKIPLFPGIPGLWTIPAVEWLLEFSQPGMSALTDESTYPGWESD